MPRAQDLYPNWLQTPLVPHLTSVFSVSRFRNPLAQRQTLTSWVVIYQEESAGRKETSDSSDRPGEGKLEQRGRGAEVSSQLCFAELSVGCQPRLGVLSLVDLPIPALTSSLNENLDTRQKRVKTLETRLMVAEAQATGVADTTSKDTPRTRPTRDKSAG